MYKTLRISFLLKNTYRVNTILYSLKQVPILKKLLPNTLYQMEGLKVFANVISILWEVISMFLGKLIYFLLMILGASMLYPIEEVRRGELFLHIFLLLTVIGSFVNTYMFNPTKDKYYALVLMRMNSREYTLINYFYAIIKILLGFTLFGLIFGNIVGLPIWICLLLPPFVASLKLSVAAYLLWKYERTGDAANENKLSKLKWVAIFLLLALGYGLPVMGIVLPVTACILFMVISILLGFLSLTKILKFQSYGAVYREILTPVMNQMDQVKQVTRNQTNKVISTDIGISSNKVGFEYLNELFIKRHQKILWKSAKRITMICFTLLFAVLLIVSINLEAKEYINKLLMVFLPYFVFIMYIINRGTGFTRALFINCDHSLLTYSFYKEPKFILQLFQIRLREIIRINMLPGAVIGIGLAILLFVSGGTDNPMNYVVLIVSILCMSIFFSTHYLTIYYLLQPYNEATEIKSATYQIIMTATYMVCYFMMQFKMDTLFFGLMTIVFCLLYSFIASILVYKLAPKTFKLRT